jgi:hypothetical protein
MATTRWLGRALATAQVDSIAVTGTWAAADTVTLTVNAKVITVTVGATVTTAAVATAIKEAINGDTITGDATRSEDGDNVTEFTEFTAEVSSSTVTVTGATKGVPYTLAVGYATAGNGEANLTNTTAATGPWHWDNAANWSNAAVPVNSDDAIVENTDVPILYGLAQTAVTLTSLTINASFTGTIGLPSENAGGYEEYRATYLAIKATTVTIGGGEGQGSQRIRLDLSSAATTTHVRGMGSAADYPLPALLWKGTHADNVLTVTRGTVGVALLAGETATLTTLRVGYYSSQSSDAAVTAGPGLTLTTLQQDGGSVTLNAGLTTATKENGTLEVMSGNITTVTNREGAFHYRGTGTVTTLTCFPGATADFSRDMRARTVTTATLHEGSALLDPFGTVTFTNPIVTVGKTAGVTLDVGSSRSLAVS